uniref:Uncharacterized protein n=1 Tax=Steinernema glaseri TaxID=37863 RepID=A0A1I7YUP4_9BILA
MVTARPKDLRRNVYGCLPLNVANGYDHRKRSRQITFSYFKGGLQKLKEDPRMLFREIHWRRKTVQEDREPTFDAVIATSPRGHVSFVIVIAEGGAKNLRGPGTEGRHSKAWLWPGMEPILIAAILFGALLTALSIVGSFYVYRYTVRRERIHEKASPDQESRGRAAIVACEEGGHGKTVTPSLNLPGQIPEALGSPRHSSVKAHPSGFRKQRSDPSEPPRSAPNSLSAQEDPAVRRKSSAALYEAELLGIGAPPLDVQSEQEELERQKRKNMMVP